MSKLQNISYFLVGSLVLGSFAATMAPSTTRAQQLVISKVTVEQSASNATGASTKITWFTNVPADGRVDYGTTTTYSNFIASSLTSETYHELTLSNLLSETTYHFKLTSVTPGGERLESFDQTLKTLKFKSTVPPSITGVTTVYVSATYAVVQWLTDRPADSNVEYATNESFKPLSTAGGNGNTVRHEVTMRGLKTGTTYFYRVRSRDKDGNQATGATQTITTGYDQAADRALLTISQVSPVSFPDSAISSTAITFTWKSSRLAKGDVAISSGSHQAENDWSVIEHRITVTGLKPATRYVARVTQRDVLGGSVTSGDITLLTNPSAPPAPRPASAVSGAACQTPYAYGAPCRDLAAEQSLARELRTYLATVFKGRVPVTAFRSWYVLVKAYVYGGYPPQALVQAVKFGGKTVHPTIPWSEWQNSRDYKAYINRQ